MEREVERMNENSGEYGSTVLCLEVLVRFSLSIKISKARIVVDQSRRPSDKVLAGLTQLTAIFSWSSLEISNVTIYIRKTILGRR